MVREQKEGYNGSYISRYIIGGSFKDEKPYLNSPPYPREVFLFDCGEGTQRQMALAGISPIKVTRIFITHLHGDHILGIPGMIQSMGFRGREEPLELYGPPGTLEVYESMMKVGYFSLDFEIQVNEITEGVVVEEDEYLVSCARGSHSVTNLAYCFQEKKRPRFLREKAIALGLKPGPDFGRLHRGYLSGSVTGL